MKNKQPQDFMKNQGHNLISDVNHEDVIIAIKSIADLTKAVGRIWGDIKKK